MPQIVAIMGRVASKWQPALVTRVAPDVFGMVKRRCGRARYHPRGA